MVQVFPQHLNIAFNGEGNFPEPDAIVGLPLYDTSANVLKFTDGSGGFNSALPEHTLSGGHGPKVTITQTSADNALSIIQPYGASAVKVQCSATGSGSALEVSSASNTSRAASITSTGTTDALLVKSVAGQNALYAETGNVNIANGNVNISAGTLTVDTDTLVTKTTGRVGIGTATPDREFDVYGGAAFRGNHLYLQNSASPVGTKSWGMVVSSSSGRFNIGQATDTLPAGGSITSVIQIVPGAPSGTFVIQGSSGRVGIATNSPAGKFEVQQDTAGSPAMVVDNNLGTRAVQIINDGTSQGVQIQNNNSHEALFIQQTQEDSDQAIQIDNTSTRSSCLLVRQQNVASTAPAILIRNSGSSQDIKGTDNSWWIDKAGNASFNNVATKFARGFMSGADSYTINFNTGVTTSGTYVGDTGFTETPYVIVAPSDSGLHSSSATHRTVWTISTLNSSGMIIDITRTNVSTAMGFYWLAVGK